MSCYNYRFTTRILKPCLRVNRAPVWINVGFICQSAILCKVNELQGKRELNSKVENEQEALIVVGVNLQKTRLGCISCGQKFLLVQFRYTSPHEISAGVSSKCSNQIAQQMKRTRVRQKQ